MKTKQKESSQYPSTCQIPVESKKCPESGYRS